MSNAEITQRPTTADTTSTVLQMRTGIEAGRVSEAMRIPPRSNLPILVAHLNDSRTGAADGTKIGDHNGATVLDCGGRAGS